MLLVCKNSNDKHGVSINKGETHYVVVYTVEIIYAIIFVNITSTTTAITSSAITVYYHYYSTAITATTASGTC